MAVNLLTLAQSYLNEEVVSQVSSRLGETQQNTRKAFGEALPAVLGSLLHKSSEPGGNGLLVDMVDEVMSPNRIAGEVIMPTGGIAGYLSSLLTSETQSNKLLSMGANITRNLFGDKVNMVAAIIASHSGVKPSSASSLMNLSGPLLLSLLGKKASEEGPGLSAAAGLLSSQLPYIQAAMSPELSVKLSSLPGFAFLGGYAGPKKTSVRLSPTYTHEVDRSSGGSNRWLPWILLVLGLLLLLYFLRSCDKSDRETATASLQTAADSTSLAISTAADSVDSKATAALDSAGGELADITAKLGTFFKRKLPSGYELNIPEFGIENKLVKFMEDKSKPVDKTTWFNFDRLLFETGKSTLKPSSQEQLTNIAYILKEYPNVHIILGGYTDNTGSAAVNKKLSQERAESVMDQLVKLGVDRSRLEAEGYGQEHPVASNDTEAGRAENRRIAIRVTKK
ncbi:OmpA family protein [Spirosoma koreense]